MQDLGGRRGSPALCNVGSGDILGSLETCFLKALGAEVPVVVRSIVVVQNEAAQLVLVVAPVTRETASEFLVAKVSFTLSHMHLA